jgi:hypothetical protein
MVIKSGPTHNSAKGSDHRLGELPYQSKQVLVFFFLKKQTMFHCKIKKKR